MGGFFLPKIWQLRHNNKKWATTMGKKRNVLLIEPTNRLTRTILPFGLQKIATYHIQKKDNVSFFYGVPKERSMAIDPDIVYITSLFTYTGNNVIKAIKTTKLLYPNADVHVGGVFATLMADYVFKETGVAPFKGVWHEIDHLPPDFTVFPKTNKSLVFTTRGCPRKCDFCAVKTLEPKYAVIPTWKEQINYGMPNLWIHDNNILATGWEHQKDVVAHLKANYKGVIDFNSGFDCRIFKEKHANLYRTLNLRRVRFAFDSLDEDGHIQAALELAKKQQLVKDSIGGYVVYTLYNFAPPDEFYYRISTLAKMRISIYPMRFRPRDSLTKNDYVGPGWSRELVNNFQLITSMLSSRLAYIRTYSDEDNEAFFNYFGRNVQEFIDKVSVFHIPEKRAVMGRFWQKGLDQYNKVL